MSLHPRFIEYDVLSTTVLVSGAELVSINLYEFLKFVEIGRGYIAFTFWYLWVHDDLMSVHPSL